MFSFFLFAISVGLNSAYRHEEKKDVVSTTTRVLFNIRLDPYETNNLYLIETDVRMELLSRLKYHCRRRKAYVPLLEREKSDPKLYNNIYTPWLEDWDEAEWQPTKRDIQNFETFYFKTN